MPDSVGYCPACAKPVRPKCGEIVAWHWAHLVQEDCDPWAEIDTDWHRTWQSVVPAEQREVIMHPHRADIVTTDGIVIELQHSGISPAEIAERESFYGNMIWLFNATKPVAENRLLIRSRSDKTYQTFRWMHPRKSIAYCRKPVWLDLGNDLVLRLHRMYPEAPCGGWGNRYHADVLRQMILAAR